jgi:hypothetical protein
MIEEPPRCPTTPTLTDAQSAHPLRRDTFIQKLFHNLDGLLANKGTECFERARLQSLMKNSVPETRSVRASLVGQGFIPDCCIFR